MEEGVGDCVGVGIVEMTMSEGGSVSWLIWPEEGGQGGVAMWERGLWGGDEKGDSWVPGSEGEVS